MANKLLAYCENLLSTVESTRDRVRTERAARAPVAEPSFLSALREMLASQMNDAFSGVMNRFEIAFIERANFWGDIVFRSTELIREDKAKYLGEICPALVAIIPSLELNGEKIFESVEQKGIYVNACLRKDVIFRSLGQIAKLGERYGQSNSGSGKDTVVDYSSPNAAKHLHAGHIRSTIIGHVLGNLYDATGYSVHRINYLNDWGGVGYLIEGLSRREADIDQFENKNDFLFAIYTAFRRAEKSSANPEEFTKLSDQERLDITALLWDISTHEKLLSAFAAYKSASIARFRALESGEEQEFEAWRKIVEWSMEDFRKFYGILGIQQDYLTGESLYSILGKDLVKNAIATGKVVFFDESKATEEVAKVNDLRSSGALSDEVSDRLIEEIRSDIGGYVVMLANFERYVVLKWDESTIYATRDLAALKHRSEVFAPSKIVYEVGQEQQDHFAKLFESSKILGFGEGIDLKHVYHGFYVSEETKKKLSSRDGASNIIKLLNDTIAYFRSKYDDNTEWSDEEKDHIARTLWVGSIVFNDIKKDRKSSVAISADPKKMMLQFEESGGAYLIYASCRAKSILRKYAKPIPSITDIDSISEMTIEEIDLIKRLLEFPDVVRNASENDDIVRVTEYLMKLAAAYNSYYNTTPVLKGENIEYRLIITESVSRVIDNGLNLLHVGTLERI